ncbi:hypothetical protein, partial [Spelaeicoccus albus]|uniref:hypothetical protein n=1 Tax=Spelaeicoccus albus TaxID=1280376 RepID=UPI001F3AE453
VVANGCEINDFAAIRHHSARADSHWPPLGAGCGDTDGGEGLPVPSVLSESPPRLWIHYNHQL